MEIKLVRIGVGEYRLFIEPKHGYVNQADEERTERELREWLDCFARGERNRYEEGT